MASEISLRLSIDGPSLRAARSDMERHFLKYGCPPQPHLKKETEADMARIMDNMKACFFVERQ